MSMKRILLVSMIVLLAVSLAGCKKKEAPAEGDGKGVTMEGMKEQAKEAMEATGEYLAEQKDKLVAASQEQLDNLKSKFDDLQAKAQSEEAKQQYSQMKTQFDKQLEQAKAKMQDLKDASADTWDSAQKGVKDAMDSLKQTYDKAASQFSE